MNPTTLDAFTSSFQQNSPGDRNSSLDAAGQSSLGAPVPNHGWETISARLVGWSSGEIVDSGPKDSPESCQTKPHWKQHIGRCRYNTFDSASSYQDSPKSSGRLPSHSWRVIAPSLRISDARTKLRVRRGFPSGFDSHVKVSTNIYKRVNGCQRNN